MHPIIIHKARDENKPLKVNTKNEKSPTFKTKINKRIEVMFMDNTVNKRYLYSLLILLVFQQAFQKYPIMILPLNKNILLASFLQIFQNFVLKVPISAFSFESLEKPKQASPYWIFILFHLKFYPKAKEIINI